MQTVSQLADDSLSVVIVDDDELFRESLAQNLSDAGFRVTDFDNGPAALAHLGQPATADLVVLDWRMPAMNGIEVLRRLRERDTELPVIFLTALTEQIYEEAALATGAVDFVDKSRSFGILLRRIQLILDGAKARRARPEAEEAEGDLLTVGDLLIRRRSGRASWKDRPVELTFTEVRMVQHLAEHAGEDVTYRALYDVVHGEGFQAGLGSDGYRGNVRTFIKRIRQKFRDVDDQFEQIENYPGFGYRWRG